jgi:plastocyanin
MRPWLVITALAAALALEAAQVRGPHPAEVDASDTVRMAVVADWSRPHGTIGGYAPDSEKGAAAGAGRQGPSGPTGSLVGRVDIRSPATASTRRPEIGVELPAAPRDQLDLRRAIVYLESAPTAAFEAPEPMRGRIDQRDETFVPHVMAVSAGSVVDFPNNDRTYHNVFSLSKTRRFDLGRYAQGKSRAVRFARPGIVRVFCDIQSHMSAFVLVFSHPFFATTDADGRYRIDDIPPGRYTVAAWFEGENRDTRSVTLAASGGPVDLDFVVP